MLNKAVGLVMKGYVHNAPYDVRSMAKAIHFLEEHYNIFNSI